MSPFGKLFWGFLIVFIDIRIKGFDVLIDLVGCIAIVVGLSQLAKRNVNFERARRYANALLALSILDLFTRPPRSSSDTDVGLFGSPVLAIGFVLALLVVNLMMVNFICRGIGEMARGIGDAELANQAVTRWQVFFWAQVASLLFLVLVFASPDTLFTLFLAAVLAGLVAAVLIAALLRRADKVFYATGS